MISAAANAAKTARDLNSSLNLVLNAVNAGSLSSGKTADLNLLLSLSGLNRGLNFGRAGSLNVLGGRVAWANGGDFTALEAPNRVFKIELCSKEEKF